MIRHSAALARLEDRCESHRQAPCSPVCSGKVNAPLQPAVQEHGAPHCPGWLWQEARQRQPETPGQGRSSPLASRLHPGERSVPTATSSPRMAQPQLRSAQGVAANPPSTVQAAPPPGLHGRWGCGSVSVPWRRAGTGGGLAPCSCQGLGPTGQAIKVPWKENRGGLA